MKNPAERRTLEEFSAEIGASARTLARLFLRETGLSFGAWRRRRILLAALEHLSNGAPVTTVALEMGYDSPSAFFAMFRQTLGKSPTQYLMAEQEA